MYDIKTWGLKSMDKSTTEKKFVVRGDHSILARPDKYGLTEDEVDKLVSELVELGYENIVKEEL